MDIFQNFSCGEERIEVYGTLEKPLFLVKNIAKVFNIVSINSHVIDYDETEKIHDTIKTNGGIQKCSFLTEKGFYKFIINSRKEKSDKLKNWIFTILCQLRLNGVYKLGDLIENDESTTGSNSDSENTKKPEKKVKKINKIQIEENKSIDDLFIESQLKISRHNALLEASKKSRVIYICELIEKFENKTLIKIGKTDDIKQRIIGLKTQYQKPVILLHVFHCDNNSEFEKYLHNHEQFKKNRFTESLENGETSREIYMLDDYFNINYILDIVSKNIKKYEKLNYDDYIEIQNNEIEKLRLNLEIEKERNKNLSINLNKTQNINCDPINDSEISDNIKIIKVEETIAESDISDIQENNTEINISQNENIENEYNENDFIKKRKKKIVNYIQQYDVNGNLIKYYESFIDLIRDIPGTSVSGLKHSMNKSSLYHGFRWKIIEKTEDPTLKFDIGQTNEIKVSRREFIAHLNIDKTTILKVYSEQKDFAKEYKLSHSAVCCAIKRESRTQGGYIKYYDDCPIELRELYEQNNNLPEIQKKGNSLTVSKIDKKTNEILKIYDSIADAIKENPMSRSSLQYSSKNNTIHNNFKWKINEL
jgi:prophage antirepressor-like protein